MSQIGFLCLKLLSLLEPLVVKKFQVVEGLGCRRECLWMSLFIFWDVVDICVCTGTTVKRMTLDFSYLTSIAYIIFCLSGEPKSYQLNDICLGKVMIFYYSNLFSILTHLWFLKVIFNHILIWLSLLIFRLGKSR